jgi:hypothetical protein
MGDLERAQELVRAARRRDPPSEHVARGFRRCTRGAGAAKKAAPSPTICATLASSGCAKPASKSDALPITGRPRGLRSGSLTVHCSVPSRNTNARLAQVTLDS